MRHKLYLLEESVAREFLQLSHDMRQAKRGMSATEMREAVAEIYSGARINYAAKASYEIDMQGVAYIPITGLLVDSVDPCSAMFGMNATEYGFVENATIEADNDPAVKQIVYEMDTPGGYASGVEAVGRAIKLASVPTTARIHGLGASAGYWLASQADRIVSANETARIGSIGVVVEFIDDTKAMEDAGYEYVVLTSTNAPDKRKDLSTDEGRAALVTELDELHEIFAARVAAGRRVSVETVNEQFGKGAALIARKALAAGMIDEIEADGEVGQINTGNTPVVDGTTTAAKAETLKEGVMDLKTLKTEHPDVFAAAVEIGVQQERARESELRSYIEADPENAQVRQVVEQAMAEGKHVSDINAKLQVAIRDGGKLDGENPPPVDTSGDRLAGVTEEDRKAAKIAGMSIEEYVKYSKEAE